MGAIDVTADTDLRRHALDAAETFVRGHGCPVQRAQIAGLLQIAANEPAALPSFASKQRDRASARAESTTNARKKAEFEKEAEFWKVIQQLCASLKQARDAASVPADCVNETLPPGAKLTKEQQAERKERDARRRAWERQWDLDHYAAFFRAFCAHYLYRKPPGED